MATSLKDQKGTIDHYYVHNANLLGASLLIRLYETCRNMRNCNEGKELLDSRLRGNDRGGAYSDASRHLIPIEVAT